MKLKTRTIVLVKFSPAERGVPGDERESVEEINEKFRGNVAWVEASSKG